MVQKLTVTDAMQALCKATKKWGMYINIYSPRDFAWVPELDVPAAPYLNLKDDGQLISDEVGILLFDTEKECQDYYDLTVGDDGPSLVNEYDGPQRVYALTCNPEGELENENT